MGLPVLAAILVAKKVAGLGVYKAALDYGELVVSAL